MPAECVSMWRIKILGTEVVVLEIHFLVTHGYSCQLSGCCCPLGLQSTKCKFKVYILSLLQSVDEHGFHDISPAVVPLRSNWRPPLRQPPHSHRDGGSSRSGQDVHVQEAHPIPQLDRHAHQRYTTLTNTYSNHWCH